LYLQNLVIRQSGKMIGFLLSKCSNWRRACSVSKEIISKTTIGSKIK
jgi:hypothetical protein